MNTFRFSSVPLDTAAERARIADPACGGYASFEGWVRNQNEGQQVRHLEYEAFELLAVREGERIIQEAIERFGVEHAACVHRVGDLALGDMAVWVGASARHRQEAFLACRYIIDEVKHRLPIWKKEHYVSGDSGWVNCERCATAPRHTREERPGDPPPHRDHHAHGHGHGHGGAHDHGHDHDHDRGRDTGHDAQAAAPRRPAATATAGGGAGNFVSDYSRQMTLKEVGAGGQARLRAARVLVVGAGGLGVPVLGYLAGAGIGRIGIIDGDRVEPSNLHRQPLYRLADAGQMKAALAAAHLRALNPDVDVQVYGLRLDAGNGADLIAGWDLVIDCTDNFTTKFLINDLCVQAGKPAILSSIYQYEGQLQVIRPERGGACLRCIWPHATRDGLVGNCAEAGVLGPVPGVFGSLQALEALKLILDLPGQLDDGLLVIDLLTLAVSRMKARRAPECAAGPCRRIPATPAGGATVELAVRFASLQEAEGQGYAIIDVREAAEVAAEPAPARTVHHIPLQRLLREGAGHPADARLLIICATGVRSLAAAQELAARGHGAVYSLTGGLAGLRKPA